MEVRPAVAGRIAISLRYRSVRRPRSDQSAARLYRALSVGRQAGSRPGGLVPAEARLSSVPSPPQAAHARYLVVDRRTETPVMIFCGRPFVAA